MIRKLNSFNIQTENEKIIYYNYGKYIIFDLITLDYIVVDKTKYKELFNNYRNYIKNKPSISANESELFKKNKKQFLDIMIITGFDCNYNCTYCYQKEYKKIKSKMDIEDLEKIKEYYQVYDDLFNTDSIIKGIGVMGGEPFLDSNWEFIKNIFDKFPEAKVNFTTNGSNIARYKSLIKKNKEKIDIIMLSIDGTKSTHLKYRKALDVNYYDSIWDTLEFALNNEIKVQVSSVYHPEENESYPEFFDMLENYGWLENSFQVGLYLDITKIQSSNEKDTYLNLAKKSFKDLIKLDSRANNLGQNIINNTQNEMMSMIKRKNLFIPYKSCDITVKPSYTFLPTGDVFGCLGTNNPKFKLGTFKSKVYVNKKNIENIYNHDFRNMEKCKKCDYKYFCRGGCIAKNLEKYNNLDIGYCSRWNEGDYKESFEKVFDQLIIGEIKKIENKK